MRYTTYTATALATLFCCVPHMTAQAQQQLPGIVIDVEGGDAPAGPTPGGRTPADGRLTTNAGQTTNPVDSASIIPQDFQNYAGAGNRVAREQIDEQRPLTNHEALSRVPGVITYTDDGLARHGGVGIRGSNFRRSRKVLFLEDGQSINYSSYIDPSTHYTPPMERVENIEVIRGTVVSQGPLTNHGVINFQNLNPFGKSETVIKGALSYTEDSQREVGNSRHIHTRQNLGNFGAVASYSGAEGAGAWDNERLRYNDFYGALGMRGSQQDLTISGGYFRQRDDYDEDNFGGTVAEFFANGRDKSGVEDDARTEFNTFNADYWRLQVAHNAYITDDITLSTRLYGSDHERNRLSNRRAALEDGGFMRGRNRDYEVYGADSRIEFANLPLFAGITHDVQAGVRYEHHRFSNCTSFGQEGEVLNANNTGNCTGTFVYPTLGRTETSSVEEFEANAFSAFIQTAIQVTPNFTITPGVRFEDYTVEGRSVFPDGDERGTSDHTHVLPGVAMAWEFMPRWTTFAGYHRGFAPHIVRDVGIDNFPLEEEVGDNFQVGLRSSAVRGLTFDVAYFHSIIDSYQVKATFTDAETGENIFSSLDEVQFNGVELGVRAESRPITGGPWNLFGEVVYTFTNSNIRAGRDSLNVDDDETPLEDLEDVSGNRVPFAVAHYANLTVGVAYEKLWDVSATATYRGDFFTDSFNTVPLNENDAGLVDDVWLLAARANFNVSDQLTLFVSGHNLTDEFYVADVSDGAKPGQGRTLLGGFTLKFD